MGSIDDGLRRLGPRWRPLAATWLGLGVVIFLLAPRYNDAQRADGAEAFRTVVEAGGPGRFAAAAVVDVGFAVAYGLLALAVGWRAGALARVRRVAAAAVVVGALCDGAENLLVLANVVGRESLGDGRIDAMRALGDLKRLLGLGGATALVVALLVEARRRP